MNKDESKYFKSAEKMQGALISLLDRKEFEHISIKEICETAGVNRSTFYLHYDNANDLLSETVEAVYKDFFGHFRPEDTKESGCRQMKLFLPISAASFLAKILEKKAKKTGAKPLMTTFSVYNLARNNRFDSSKASRDLGYTTRPYRETIRDEIRWLKDTGKIA